FRSGGPANRLRSVLSFLSAHDFFSFRTVLPSLLLWDPLFHFSAKRYSRCSCPQTDTQRPEFPHSQARPVFLSAGTSYLRGSFFCLLQRTLPRSEECQTELSRKSPSASQYHKRDGIHTH